ncbi:hypothetical protein [Flavobacterium aquidurense]|uniref:Uncharacterized protein n=1 Tax=Flavobacterium aquidurense TaxID=362413 RepID=A0A0N8VLT9_9FLAO|nr:hypothetical protein [Flavobacterium aquidurense]KQB37452.1 hypothetical protein RC62_2618 [Flavobacterium aquidurense]
MKKMLILIIISCLTLSFCISKPEKIDSDYTLAFVKEIYIDRDNSGNEEKDIRNFIGVFPKNKDTITVYQLNSDLTEKPQLFSYWVKNKNNNSVVFACSESEQNIKVIFDKNNIVKVENDVYSVNNQYYDFLKQKILIENSVLDLAFFLKDGYGDYSQSLEPLNKNWRNQKENNSFKIISVKIKNRNYQTDNQFFEYKIAYEYKKNGQLQSILSNNRFNKVFVKESKTYTIYSIEDEKNERSSSNAELYKNKKTLFDSISGNWTQNSTVKTSHFLKYQSKLKLVDVAKKPRNLDESIKLLKIEKKDLE